MTKARTRREDRPVIILDAAERLIRRSGTRTLTIDAVAAEASLSKGGVLHHFSSKDALITALAERKLQSIKDDIAQHEADQAPGVSALPLAMIAHAKTSYCDEDGFPRALLLATADNPEACAGFNEFLRQHLARLEEIPGVASEAAMITFATLGLMISRTLGFHNLEGQELARFFDALEAAARSLPEKSRSPGHTVEP
ncbi:MAG: TetR/AcrR family transcriptional regulator [Methylobacterium sp.]|nr:TetR/AcrR family transcriptional regulator [Methylobacterium sp.]